MSNCSEGIYYGGTCLCKIGYAPNRGYIDELHQNIRNMKLRPSSVLLNCIELCLRYMLRDMDVSETKKSDYFVIYKTVQLFPELHKTFADICLHIKIMYPDVDDLRLEYQVSYWSTLRLPELGGRY